MLSIREEENSPQSRFFRRITKDPKKKYFSVDDARRTHLYIFSFELNSPMNHWCYVYAYLSFLLIENASLKRQLKATSNWKENLIFIQSSMTDGLLCRVIKIVMSVKMRSFSAEGSNLFIYEISGNIIIGFVVFWFITPLLTFHWYCNKLRG